MNTIGPVELAIAFGVLFVAFRWLKRRRDDAHEAMRLNSLQERREITVGLPGDVEALRRLE